MFCVDRLGFVDIRCVNLIKIGIQRLDGLKKILHRSDTLYIRKVYSLSFLKCRLPAFDLFFDLGVFSDGFDLVVGSDG